MKLNFNMRGVNYSHCVLTTHSGSVQAVKLTELHYHYCHVKQQQAYVR